MDKETIGSTDPIEFDKSFILSYNSENTNELLFIETISKNEVTLTKEPLLAARYTKIAASRTKRYLEDSIFSTGSINILMVTTIITYIK